jgi:uncharacterized protein (DUF433 family)
VTAEGEIDWSGCPLVEVNLRTHSGAPVLRGTRMPVSVAEISEQFEISPDLIEAILSYATGQRLAHPVR